MFEIIETEIKGCFHIKPRVKIDARGCLIKVFNATYFEKTGIHLNFKEVFYTLSDRNVMRGMHFQVPPCDGGKIVYCLAGDVVDVILDIRKSSPTFGKYKVFELSSKTSDIVYMEAGLAHGFFVKSNRAILMYHSTFEYSSTCDKGLLWNSFGAPWPTKEPVLSSRDKSFPKFFEYESPF